jgi:NADH pyrophosphatase NudC (nudix superfamily)
MSDAYLMVLTFFQCCPWPISCAVMVWIAARAFGEHSVRIAAELNDASVLEAKALAARAARDVQEARDAWESATATTNEELSVIKGALLER